MPEIKLVGDADDLPNLIVMADVMNQLLEEYQSTGSSRPLPYYVKGQILVTILFKGRTTDKKRHRVEKSFRIKDDPRNISEGKLKLLSTNIVNQFKNFTYTTGTDAYTYNDSEAGFNRCWSYFKSQNDAKKMFKSLLKINENNPDWEKMSKSSVPIPGTRFSAKPGKVSTAGIPIRTSAERPIATMLFDHAVIKFPHLHKSLVIVDKLCKPVPVITLLKELAKRD